MVKDVSSKLIVGSRQYLALKNNLFHHTCKPGLVPIKKLESVIHNFQLDILCKAIAEAMVFKPNNRNELTIIAMRATKIKSWDNIAVVNTIKGIIGIDFSILRSKKKNQFLIRYKAFYKVLLTELKILSQ